MYDKKRIMTRAHILHKHRPDHTIGDMLCYAWYFERDFRRLLSSQPVRFSYFKRDGSVREALGTLNFDLIPSDKIPGASPQRNGESGLRQEGQKNYSVFPYYDLDRCAWRSFDIRNFIGFVEPVDQPTGTPVDR